MDYFLDLYDLDKTRYFLLSRKFRNEIFKVGDVIGVYFRTLLATNFFEGVCLAKKKKNTPEFTFILRNILSNIGIELNLSFFYNRAFFYKINDYKRKTYFYHHNKLYYLRRDEHFFNHIK